VVTTIPEFPQ